MIPSHASGASIGNWSLDWRLGEGSSAIVYRCVNATGLVAAMKLARDALARPRIEREAQTLARGLHPALPRLLEHLDGGFVMELIQGSSLRGLVVEAATAAGIGAQLSQALGALHAAGLAHGDLSPQNVLVDRSGDTRLIDLGGVCGADEVTRAHTTGFAAPEPEPTGADQDRYALGVLLQGLADAPPPEMAAVIRALLSPDPAQRPRMDQVFHALDPLATRPGAVVAATLAEAATQLPIEPGPFGRYTLERRRGRGAMGEVWQAQDGVLRRKVALKLSFSEQGRFLREARALARLDHPSLVRLLDFGQQDGRSFLAMDLVEGPSLQARLEAGPLSEAELLPLAQAIAEGLAAVHHAGLLHRDLKPANILLAPEGPRLADFGLASSAEGSQLTQEGARLGTPAYMAPEQARGEPLTPAADVYGLGATLYRAISGRRPFPGSDPVQVLAQVSEGPPPRLEQGSPGLRALVARCMAAHPADRPQDGQALVAELERLARGQSIQPPSALRPWLRQHRGGLTLGLAGLLAAGATLWAATGRQARLSERAQIVQQQQVAALEAQAAELALRDPQAALRLLTEGLEAPPLRHSAAAAQAWLRHARDLDARGDPSGADQARARAFIHHPQPAQVLAELGLSLQAQGQLEAARQVGWILAELPDPGPESDALIAAARVASGDLAGAQGPLRSVLMALDASELVPDPGAAAQPLHQGSPLPAHTQMAQLPDSATPEWIYAEEGVWGLDPDSGARRELVTPIPGSHEDLLLAQVKPGGAPELVLPSGAWGPFDLRVFSSAEPAPYPLLVRLPVGHISSLAALPHPDGDLLLLPIRHLYGSREVFPQGDPEGLGAGLHVLGLRGGRLQVLDSFWDAQGYDQVFSADVDGDGRLEGFAQSADHLLVIAERQGSVHHQWIAGVDASRRAGDLDGDGDEELYARVDGQWRVLGSGDQPFPRSGPPPSTQVAQAQVRRAVQLDELGLHEASISSLERLLSDPELRALAAWELGGVHQRAEDLGRAEAAWILAIEDPELGEQALRALAENAWEDHRAADAIAFNERLQRRYPDSPPLPAQTWAQADARHSTLDFRGAIPPQVWVQSHGLQVTGDGLRISRAQDTILLRIPLQWDGHSPLRVELDADIERLEWGSGLRVSLEDSAGGWFLGQIFGMGGAQAVGAELSCGDGQRRRPARVLPQDAALVELSGLWTFTFGPERSRCHHPAWPQSVSMDIARPLSPGRVDLLIGSSSYASANEARSLLRSIEIHGAELLELPEPTPTLRAAAHGELSQDGDLETQLRRLMSQGRREAVQALWDAQPELPPFVGALLRERPDLWIPILWADPHADPLSVYGVALIGALAQHPGDPELDGEILELRGLESMDHPDPELLALLLFIRGEALLRRGDLASARAHLERSQALQPTPLSAGRALVQLELAAGDPDAAMDLALELVSGQRYTVADHLALHPALGDLHTHPRWPELEAARALEEPPPPR